MNIDINVIAQLIGSLGFPIVCCGYFMVKTNKAIENNTKITQQLYNFITAMFPQAEIKIGDENE